MEFGEGMLDIIKLVFVHSLYLVLSFIQGHRLHLYLFIYMAYLVPRLCGYTFEKDINPLGTSLNWKSYLLHSVGVKIK